jgi:multiple sugar transport system permease protein
LGAFVPITPLGSVVFGVVVVVLAIFLARYLRNARVSSGGLIGRAILTLGLGTLAWMLVHTLGNGGRLGTISVTLVYVFVGIFFQYILGLSLAMLTVQRLPGRRFFRVIFLLPMMITPVGVAYMFRMLTDTGKGPFTPIWQALGLINFSWVNNAGGARTAILIADIWQWTPFMFIVLVAALESQPMEPLEAATVDGANAWQIFRYITWPAILPVSMTLILIRLIEAFKIVDLPNVMTNGGPGTATESLTLQAFINWRALDLGSSAAVAYILLFLVTFFSMILVNLIRHRVVETL